MTGWIEGAPATQTTWDTTWDTMWDYVPSSSDLILVQPTGPLLAANCTGDILLQWDNTNTIGDWMLADGDLQTGQDLETACLVSLFTDKRATPDFVPTDGTNERRGWWADQYLDQPLGSNLWQLERAHKTRDTLGLAQRYASDALQWLVTDGVAASVVIDTRWVGNDTGSTMLGIAIYITKPNGALTRFVFGWAWEGLATLRKTSQGPPLALAGGQRRRIAA